MCAHGLDSKGVAAVESTCFCEIGALFEMPCWSTRRYEQVRRTPRATIVDPLSVVMKRKMLTARRGAPKQVERREQWKLQICETVQRTAPTGIGNDKWIELSTARTFFNTAAGRATESSQPQAPRNFPKIK